MNEAEVVYFISFLVPLWLITKQKNYSIHCHYVHKNCFKSWTLNTLWFPVKLGYGEFLKGQFLYSLKKWLDPTISLKSMIGGNTTPSDQKKIQENKQFCNKGNNFIHVTKLSLYKTINLIKKCSRSQCHIVFLSPLCRIHHPLLNRGDFETFV